MNAKQIIATVNLLVQEKGQATMSRLMSKLVEGESNPDKLLEVVIADLYWFANLVADQQKDLDAALAETAGQTELSEAIKIN